MVHTAPPANRHPVTRRHALAALASLPFAAGAQAAALPGPIRIGQSTAMSGPLGDLGLGMHNGAKAFFARLNAQGGVNGRAIELVARDDGYDVKRALANANALMDDPTIFSLFNCMGTPAIAAMLPRVKETGIPFFAPFTGALLARPKDARNIFNIRPSYPDEAEKLVVHLATIGVRRISIAYQNNAFGKEIFDGAMAAMARQQMKPVDFVTVETSGADAAAASLRLSGGNPEAVIVGVAGKSAIEFIKSYRARRRGASLYALSVLSSAATLRDLGEDGVGITISQVMPAPNSQTMKIVREFHESWQAAGIEQEPSYLALEGFINAKAFATTLARAGKNPTRESFINAGWTMGRQDLGGFDVHFTQPGANGSRFVELTMVGRGGRLIR